MKNKMPKMDMGGLYTGASTSREVQDQPVSGYGTMGSSDYESAPPKRKKGYDYKAHSARNKKAFKNRGKCGRKGC